LLFLYSKGFPLTQEGIRELPVLCVSWKDFKKRLSKIPKRITPLRSQQTTYPRRFITTEKQYHFTKTSQNRKEKLYCLQSSGKATSFFT